MHSERTANMLCSSYWECEELGLDTCASSSRGWCNLGMSIGVGGGMGFLGIVVFGFGLNAYNSARRFDDKINAGCSVFLAIIWCLLWSSGVVIWGGEEGAITVGIIWGVGLLAAVAMVTCNTRRN